MGKLCHGVPVFANHVKVLVHEILLPDEKTTKANRLARTFREVGVGGFMVHPTAFTRF